MIKRSKKLELARETVVALTELSHEQKAMIAGGACSNHSSVYTSTTLASATC